MGSFQDIFGNFAFLGLMVLAILGLVITVQNLNESVQPLSEHELINETFTNITSLIGSAEGESKSKYNLFSSEKPRLGFGSIVLFTIVTVGKTFGNLIFGLFTFIIKIPLIILGVNQTIVSMIISFLTISIVIALWIVYKFGG